jgi:hypothetical protein
MLMAILQRWLLFGWLGRTVSLALALYVAAWLAGNLGAHALARQLGSAAIFIASLLLTALVIRGVWRSYTAPPRR